LGQEEHADEINLDSRKTVIRELLVRAFQTGEDNAVRITTLGFVSCKSKSLTVLQANIWENIYAPCNDVYSEIRIRPSPISYLGKTDFDFEESCIIFFPSDLEYM